MDETKSEKLKCVQKTQAFPASAMYFKASIRTNPAAGGSDGYYRLGGRCRNVEAMVWHRTFLNVGFMDVMQPALNRIPKRLHHKCKIFDNLQINYS
jgi:hypothetical protein